MEKTHIESKSVDVLDAILCDVCGSRIASEDHAEYPELIRVGGVGGYGSVIGDGVRWSLDICQHCFVERLGPFIQRDYDLGDDQVI